jgi:hypothetical protein
LTFRAGSCMLPALTFRCFHPRRDNPFTSVDANVAVGLPGAGVFPEERATSPDAIGGCSTHGNRNGEVVQRLEGIRLHHH